MESDAQETLYRIFTALSGAGGGLVSGALAAVTQNASQTGAATPGTTKQHGSGAGSIVTDVLKSGLGLVPIVSTLFGLFGASDDASPPPLVKYALPASVNLEAAETSSGLANVDRNQFGAARAYEAATVNAAAPQVNVTVQAMDARSFLDRSSDIAAAVREAMLNLNSINDVVNDL